MATPDRTVFGEWLNLRLGPSPGARTGVLSLVETEIVSRAVRGALLHHSIDPPPEVLSGHGPDGACLVRPHAAFFPLPSLSHGLPVSPIAGAVVVLPRLLAATECEAVRLAAERWAHSGLSLRLGALGAPTLVAEPWVREPGHDSAPPWRGPARHWASITPIALDRNPGDLRAGAAKGAAATRRAVESIERACQNIGLPLPIDVRIGMRSALPGAPPAPAFTPYPRRGSGFKRVCVHAELQFDRAVTGPVLLGFGRYLGVGLCWPLPAGGPASLSEC